MEHKHGCNGLIFQPHEQTYATGSPRKGTFKYAQKRELKLLRRLSCNNCPRCIYMMEQLVLDADELNFMVESLDISKKYQLVLIDEFEVEFKPIQEQK